MHISADLLDETTKESVTTTSFGTAPILTEFVTPQMAADKARSWLDQCLRSHTSCTTNEKPQLPKRVIKVTNANGLPHLYESCGENADYIALSYCRRSPETLTTTKGTISSRLQGIIWDDIPKTFQDAILFTEHLGIDYIWIDALCIIQDDQQDWQAETAKMNTVYQNALLTLSATSSPHVAHGIFGDLKRNKTFKLKFPGVYARRSCSRTQWHLFSRWEYSGFINKNPTEEVKAQISSLYPSVSRGWIFQERLLSKRILHCAQDEMIWDCRESIQGESSPTTQSHVSRPGANPFSQFKTLDMRSERFRNKFAVITLWVELVGPYTLGRFTKDSDRLVALSGVAKCFQPAELGGYVAGMWSNFLHVQLGWSSWADNPRESRRIAEPSWSWASINQTVDFGTISFQAEDYGHTDIGDEKSFVRPFQVHKAVTTLDSPDPTGSVNGGTLIGSALTVGGVLELTASSDSENDKMKVKVRTKSNSFDAEVDVQQWKPFSRECEEMQPSERLRQGEEVLCAELYSLVGLYNPWLVLRWSHAAEAYRRVGLIDGNDEMTNYAEAQMITIV